MSLARAEAGRLPDLPSIFTNDGPTLDLAARDFGGLVHGGPRAVARPESVEDVALAIRHARAARLAIAPRGQGHCTRGQALAPDGLVLDMRGLRSIEVGDGFVTAGAGARWDEVVRTAFDQRLAPAVLTDYLGLSVGGTLSVGGVGGQSFRHGLQIDQVDGLTVVTGRGEVLDCSPTQNVDLFDACRGGLGQFAVIVGASIRLLPAPEEVLVCRLTYPDVQSWLADQARLAGDGRFDYLLGSILPGKGTAWTFSLEAAKYLFPSDVAGPSPGTLLSDLAFVRGTAQTTRTPFLEYANRLGTMEAAARATGSWHAHHPWMDLFLPAVDALHLVAAALAELEPSDFMDGHLLTYPLITRNCGAPLGALPAGPSAFLFDVLPTVALGDREGLDRLDRVARRIWLRARERGARVYPIGFPLGTELMTHDAWRLHFGDQWHRLAAAKRMHDPDGVLTPSPGIFGCDERRREL